MRRCDVPADSVQGGCQYGDVIRKAETKQKVRHHVEWKHKISQDAKEFLDAVLDPDPNERLSVSQLLTHNWFATSKENDWEDDGAALEKRTSSLSDDSDYDAELLKRMQYFAKADKVEKAAMTILAVSLHQEDILNLRKLFVEIDTENDGRISAYCG